MNSQKHDSPPVLDQNATNTGQYIRETASQLGETAARATEGLEKGFGNIGHKFDNVRHSVIDKTKEYSQATDNYVKTNPWLAVGISAGLAFLVGIFVGRRRDY